jgi:hypothetical protein
VAALRLRTVELPPDVTVIGMKEAFTVQTFTLSSGMCHRPESPQAYDAKTAVWKEENRNVKRMRKKSEEDRRKGLISSVGEEEGIA